jgi:hypothetical protein
MPSAAGNLGVDYSFGYFDANSNSLVDLGSVQDVKETAMKHDLKNTPYNSPPVFDYAPDGYKFTFRIARYNSGLEDLLILREQYFNSGAIIKPGYLNKTVNNYDGTISRYQFQNFVFFMSERGDVSREKIVMQSAEGMASTVKPI